MVPFPSMSLPRLDFPLCVSASSTQQCPDQNAEAESCKKTNKQKNSKKFGKKKKITMSHCASACLVGWKLPCHRASLSELNLVRWASCSKPRLPFSASTGLCVSNTPWRGGVQVTDSPANLRDKANHVLHK